MGQAVFYSDGSLLDGPSKLLGRCGWAFVAVNPQGFVLAAAYGVTPPCISCIPGAEAWAALQASKVAMPGSTFRIDCEPCVKAIHAGMARASTDSNPLARVHQYLAIAFDDTPISSVVWMPSHTSPRDVGARRIGNGDLLSELDRFTNGPPDMPTIRMGDPAGIRVLPGCWPSRPAKLPKPGMASSSNASTPGLRFKGRVGTI